VKNGYYSDSCSSAFGCIYHYWSIQIMYRYFVYYLILSSDSKNVIGRGNSIVLVSDKIIDGKTLDNVKNLLLESPELVSDDIEILISNFQYLGENK
jgi:hypothetical protein